MKELYIYNLYPRLYKNSEEWIKAIDKIADMGFNCIFINPFHDTGSTGSLYAIKDYYSCNKEFFSRNKSCEEQLKDLIQACESKNIIILMDLVANHSSIESSLVKEHEEWFIKNEDGTFKKPGKFEDGKWLIWDDIVSFNFEAETNSDLQNLWNYFYDIALYYLNIGFHGFRCDAAYRISAEFWYFLISKIKKKVPAAYFLAETLGCTPVQIQYLSKCGFDYFFNSSKWWNFNDTWCLEQYDITRHIAPSISFPETHDTNRLMSEVENNEKIFLQRLYFSGLFSKGFMIPTGLEYGFTKKINTAETKPQDWENTGKNYSESIKKLLEIKSKFTPLHEESPIEIVEHDNWLNVFCFIKIWNDENVLICLNKDINKSQKIDLISINEITGKEHLKDYSPENRLKGSFKDISIELMPCEIKIFV